MINKIPLAKLYPEEKFLLSRTAEHIYKNFEQKTLPMADFSDTIFVLPSREAARLFRAKTAQKFKIHGGVSSLKILLPEELAAPPAEIRTNQPQILEIWLEILKENIEKKNISSILPEANYTDGALLSHAEYLTKVRENIILESGKDTDDFIGTLEKNSDLRIKLEAYSVLEKEFYAKLGTVPDKARVILETLQNPCEKFSGISRIILIECTEIRTAIADLLEKISSKITVEHYINATQEELDNFDKYGRPLTGKMLSVHFKRNIEECVRAYSNPVQEAMKIASFISKECMPDCIGVLNESLSSTLSHILEDKKIAVSNPAPRPLNSFYWSKLFLHITELRSKNLTFENIFFFASDESVLNYFGSNSFALQIQKEIEKLQREHLIPDFQTLKYFIDKYPDQYNSSRIFCNKLEELQKKVQQLDENTLPEALYNIFKDIAAANSLENMDFAVAEVSLEGLKNAVTSARSIANPSNRMLIFRHICNTTEIAGAEQFKDNAVTFSGFLDLIWHENPTLIIGGMTEESFASASQEDMLFPENIRIKLNWSSACSRFGADIHRFDQLLKQYGKDELFISYSAADTDGTLNTLPRLFFNVDDEKLLKHCKLLFGAELVEKIAPPSDANDAAKLKYSPIDMSYMPEKISVTGFKAYIDCPYNFYLKNILKAEDLDEEAIELEAVQTGNLLHSTLESYGKNYSNQIPEPFELQKTLLNKLDAEFAELTGHTANNIAVMQYLEMKNSLNAFALKEAEHRQSFASHKIHKVEYKIDIQYGDLYDRMQKHWEDLPPLEDGLHNISIVGKIDRIDIAEDADGQIFCHILDYKSSGKAKSPSEAHFASKAPEHLDSDTMFAFSGARGGNKYFADMQLIIYNLLSEFLRDKLEIPENAKIICGYYNLPADAAQTEISFFTELDDAVLRKGADALHHLMKKIFIDRHFWPPSFTAPFGFVKNYFPDITIDDLTVSEVKND